MARLTAHVFKKTALLLAALSITAAASAQRTYNPEFYLGAKGGVALSRMSFTPSVRQGWQPGATAGIIARYTEEKVFGLIGELNLEQRGWKEDFQDPRFSYSRTLTYINLPIMTHIYFGGKVKGFVNLGPSVSYLIGSSISANFNYADPGSVEGFPIRNRTTEQMSMEVKNRFDYGIAGGVGLEVRVARRHSLMLEGRYYFGIGNIFPSARRDVFSASRGMSIDVTLTYLFKVK